MERMKSDEDTNDTTCLLINKNREVRQASLGRQVAVIVASVILQVIPFGIGYSLSVFYAELVQVFNAKRTDAALVQSLYSGLTNGAAILWTPVIQRYGLGTIAVISSVGGALALDVNVFADTLVMVIIMVGCLAGSFMCANSLTAYVAVGWMFYKDPGIPLILLSIGAGLGQFIIPFLGELFIENYGWNGAFLLVSGVACQCLPCAVLLYSSKEFYVTNTAPDARVMPDIRQQARSVISDVIIMTLLLCYLLISTTGNTEAWFMVDLLVSRGFERERGSLVTSMIGLANCLGRIVGIFVKFRSRFPTIYHWVYLFPVLSVGHIVAINVSGYQAILGTCIGYGVVYGIATSQITVIIFEACGVERYPLGLALMNLMYGIGSILGGVLGGFIKDTLGQYDVMFYLAAGASMFISLSALAVSCLTRKKHLGYSSLESKH